MPLNILSGLHRLLFNVTIVKHHKIMIEGPSTMFSSPGGTQVDVYALLCFYLFLLISVLPVLKGKILEG